MITGEVEAVDRKQKIRDRYKGVDISELEVIPAKIIEDLETSSVIRRVAAYIRVSTDNDEQTSSYELQKNYYTDYIQVQPGWVFVTADVKKRLDLTGYEIVRVQYFSTMQNPAMTISNGRLRFNTACLKKFENVEYGW